MGVRRRRVNEKIFKPKKIKYNLKTFNSIVILRNRRYYDGRYKEKDL